MEDKWQTTLQHSFKNSYNSKGTCTQLLIFSALLWPGLLSLSLSGLFLLWQVNLSAVEKAYYQTRQLSPDPRSWAALKAPGSLSGNVINCYHRILCWQLNPSDSKFANLSLCPRGVCWWLLMLCIFSYSSSLNWINTTWSSYSDLLVQQFSLSSCSLTDEKKSFKEEQNIAYHITQLYKKIFSSSWFGFKPPATVSRTSGYR